MTSAGIAIVASIFFGIVAIVSAFISTQLNENENISTGKWVRLSGTGKKRYTKKWLSEFMQGISTEMVGAIINTLLLIGAFGMIQDMQADEQWKKELILQMGSPDNVTAIEAVRILSSENWLTDGSLQRAYLRNANLKGVYLQWADLQGANLFGANLQGARLSGANLKETHLQWADLQEADLQGVDLQGAYLAGTNLQGAYLSVANLQRAYLAGANLQGVRLRNVLFNTDTTLPDGSQWTEETDMSRFTNPEHSDYWQPEQDTETDNTE